MRRGDQFTSVKPATRQPTAREVARAQTIGPQLVKDADKHASYCWLSELPALTLADPQRSDSAYVRRCQCARSMMPFVRLQRRLSA